MINYYNLKVEFKGTRFLGWQIQKNFSPTVQGELNKACATIFKSEDVHTIGSGRTDSGVHSLAHVVKLTAPFEIEYEALKRGLNSILPKDIRILEVGESSKSFRPTSDALKKEYKYLFTNNEIESALQPDFISNNRFRLDFDKMRQACELFVGSHDFIDFRCTGTDVSTTVREIFECELIEHTVDFHGILPNHFVFRVVGNGFLKQMVRLMVGAVWNVGRGKTTLEELKSSLANPTGKRLGATAPPNGLYKTKVWY
jgi:tRNA pseudouridine38-40 synthase